MENEVEVKKSGTWTTNYCNVSKKHLTNKLFFNTEPNEKRDPDPHQSDANMQNSACRPSSAPG
jgi:hypothetical protein